MWWFLKKLVDDKDNVIYAYGRETKNVSGKISFDKTTEKFNIIELAYGDTEKSAKKLLPHIYHVIFKEKSPDERQIAIG